MSDPNNELESLHELPQQPCEPPADEVVAELEGDPVTADDADPESPGPAPQPENWNVLAQQTYEQLEKEMQSLHRVWDRHSYAAWLAVMQIIPRVRAFKEHIGGDAFHERCRKLCRIGKTAAGNIVRWGIAEPRVLAEIWERVHAETHAASVRGERYEYPSLSKMCGWYKPEDEPIGSSGGSTGGEDAEDEDSGANDTRSTKQLRADLLTLEDDTKKLTRRAVTAEQRLSETEDELARKLAELRDQQSSLVALRADFSALKQSSTAKDLELAAKDADIARLRGQQVAHCDGDDTPGSGTFKPTVSEPPPESPSKRTIGQAIRTEIDVKWKAPTRIGGSRMKDFERAKANRIAAYRPVA